jgi:hypothetical protein
MAGEKLTVCVVTNASSEAFKVAVQDAAREFGLASINQPELADLVVLVVVNSVSYSLAQALDLIYNMAARVIIFWGKTGPHTAPVDGFLNKVRSEGNAVIPFADANELHQLAKQRLSQFSSGLPPPSPSSMSLESAVAEIKSEIASLLRGIATPEVASVWGPPSPKDPRSVFVIMPYSAPHSIGLQKILIEVCARTGMDYTIAKLMNGRFIPQDIWKGITRAAVVIADLSGANPNVTYEVGLADVIGKETILIAQNENVPFDFLGQRLLIYSDTIEGGVQLREELIARIEAVKNQLGEKG